MRLIASGVMLFGTLAACASNRADEVSETTKEATDTVVTSHRVVDTMEVRTDSTIAADTNIVADTTIAADTTVHADTTVAQDTSRIGGGDAGVVKVDTTSKQ